MGSNPNIIMSLNQQSLAGNTFAQQAWACEQMGNIQGAAFSWDQAIAAVTGAMMQANQWQVPIPESVHFTFATYHYHGARVKAMMGADLVGWHLNMAYQGAQHAIALNPRAGAYHSFAGAVLLCMGNYANAIWELQAAVNLNPMDSWSQWMLASVYQAMGNAALMNQYYTTALQAQPGLPSLAPLPSAPGGPGRDVNSTLNTVKSVLDVVNSLFQVGNNIAGLF